MRNIFLFIVRFYLRIGLFFYYRRIKVVGKENIPKNKAVMVLGNHQNALIDPLLLAKDFKKYAYYLTRAGVFKKSFVSKLLSLFNMLPVYRIRDGWNNLTQNNEIFEKCKHILKNKKTLVLFPEGSHNLVRRVRPLSKGFTRVVLDTIDSYPELDLQILPVGFNYQKAEVFPDSVSVYYGESIMVKPLLNNTDEKKVNVLKKTVHEALTKLTTHIPEENYDEVLTKLNKQQVDYLNPELVNHCIANGLQNYEKVKTSKVLRTIIKPFMFLLLLAPILFWRLYVKPKVKEVEFVSTFRFAVSLVLIPIWLFCLVCTVYVFCGVALASYFILVALSIMLLYVKA